MITSYSHSTCQTLIESSTFKGRVQSIIGHSTDKRRSTTLCVEWMCVRPSSPRNQLILEKPQVGGIPRQSKMWPTVTICHKLNHYISRSLHHSLAAPSGHVLGRYQTLLGAARAVVTYKALLEVWVDIIKWTRSFYAWNWMIRVKKWNFFATTSWARWHGQCLPQAKRLPASTCTFRGGASQRHCLREENEGSQHVTSSMKGYSCVYQEIE